VCVGVELGRTSNAPGTQTTGGPFVHSRPVTGLQRALNALLEAELTAELPNICRF
jgi:hypothetical protein